MIEIKNLKLGKLVALPKYHIDAGRITGLDHIQEGFVGITGVTTGGFSEYRNMHFHISDLAELIRPCTRRN